MNTVKLIDIATIYNGNSINKAVKEEKYMKDVPGWNYIGTKDVGFDGTVTYKNGVVIPFSEKQFRTAPAGTVFVCSEGGSAGRKTALITEEVCFGNKLFAIVNKKGLFDSKYVYYFTRYEAFLKQFKFLASTLMGGINTKKFGSIEIPLPSIQEQERIVSRIEEMFSQLDDGVETLKKTKEQLAVYRQAVLKEAFEGRLTGNEDVTMKELKSFIEIPRYGTSKKCDYVHGDNSTEVYRIPNIDYCSGRISHNDIKYADFENRELEGITLKEGDILIIRSNGSASLVGRASMITESDIGGTFAGYLMRLRIKDTDILLPQFLLLYLQSHSARVYIENKAKSTSGVHNINSTEISLLPIPIMKKEKQEKVIEAIESRLSVCNSIEQTVDIALQQAEAMRQSILKEAFEGRL